MSGDPPNGDAPAADVLARLRRALTAGDQPALGALYTEHEDDLHLLPSTPAWTKHRGGRLAAVLDHVVFFQERSYVYGYSPLFSIPAARLRVVPYRRIGNRGFTLHGPSGRLPRVALPDARRSAQGVQCGGHRASAHNVFRDVGDIGQLGGEPGGMLGELIGSTSDLTAAPRALRIATIHQSIWLELFGRLARGESAPFE